MVKARLKTKRWKKICHTNMDEESRYGFISIQTRLQSKENTRAEEQYSVMTKGQPIRTCSDLKCIYLNNREEKYIKQKWKNWKDGCAHPHVSKASTSLSQPTVRTTRKSNRNREELSNTTMTKISNQPDSSRKYTLFRLPTVYTKKEQRKIQGLFFFF